MRSLSFHYQRCSAVILICLLLVSCGDSSVEDETSVKSQLKRAMQIRDLRTRSKKLLTIADTQFEQEDGRSAEITIRLAVDTAMEIEDSFECAATLNLAAYSYGKHELVDKAKKVLDTVADKALEVEETDNRVALLAKMGYIRIQFLDQVNPGNDLLEEAAALAEDVEAGEQKMLAKMNLAFYLNHLKRNEQRDELVAQSFTALEGISDQRQRALVAGDMASRLVEMELEEQADRAFQLAEMGAVAIEEPASRGHVLCDIAVLLLQADRISEAERVFDKAREVAEEIAKKDLRSELLQKINEKQANS